MKVYVVGSRGMWDSFGEMYSNNGFTIAKSVEEADIVQFTGGEDVTPSLYGEHKHRRTYNRLERDEYEASVYEQALKAGKFIVGVCRGGQFLNVMNGGSMYQHVEGHAIHGGHMLTDALTGKEYAVTSTHHQMMRKGEEGILVATSSDVRSPWKFHMSEENVQAEEIAVRDDIETEVVFYPTTRTLCYQPHPEYVSQDHACQRYFFGLLNRYM